MLRLLNRVNALKRGYSTCFSSLIDIKPEILTALSSNGPVVALESTIITHGMPYPHNLETAIQVEETIRQENAIPATIAIINGRIKVGLSLEELVMLAKNDVKYQNADQSNELGTTMKTIKVSRRDLAYVVSQKCNGGTTVAGTLIVADMVGINVFATGGIGGVHRDINSTMDVSADLVELGRSSVAVVSSGVKSILDIPKTLEFLETQGVCVASYKSDNKDFPAFYTRNSGSTAPYNFSSAIEAARVIYSNLSLRLNSGMLIAAPVPEKYAMDENVITSAINAALESADSKGVRGKEITPFLLSRIADITKGRSLETNMALIKNNAKIAAQIAVELSQLKSDNQYINVMKCRDDFVLNEKSNKVPVVIGASIIDLHYSIADADLKFDGATYHSDLQTFGGGVGRNIAEGISKLGSNVYLVSMVGNDQNGDYLKSLLPKESRRAIATSESERTGSFALILDKNGDCKLIVGNTDIHNLITPELIIDNEKFIRNAPIVVFDGNLSVDCIGTILELCDKYKIPAFFEPTDMRRAHVPFSLPSKLTKQIKFISPNIYELNVIAKCLSYSDDYPSTSMNDDTSNDQLFKDLKKITTFVNETIENVVVTLGPLGIMIARKSHSYNEFFDKHGQYVSNAPNDESQLRLYQTKRIHNIVNVSGAGDSFASGFIVSMIQGLPEDVCVNVGFEASKCALMSPSPVPSKYFDLNHTCWLNRAISKTI